VAQLPGRVVLSPGTNADSQEVSTGPQAWHQKAGPIHHGPSVEQILALHDEFEAPEGHRAEVIEGNIVVSPSPSGRHSLIHARLQAQVDRLLPPHLVATNTVTLRMTATNERYLPDLLVLHEDALDTDEWLFDAGKAALVFQHRARHR
jgi:Uma2 family endonuclease